MDVEVGARIRAERKRQGLSLRELADRVGVSASMLSQVETGRSRTSVTTLYALVNVLGMSLDDLFAIASGHPPGGSGSADRGGSRTSLKSAGPAAEEGDPVVRAGRTHSPVLGRQRVARNGEHPRIELESGVVWERLGHVDPDVMQFIRVTYPPGARSAPSGKFQQHTGVECGYVLSGELTLHLEFERHVLGPGDTATFDAGEPHMLENQGAEEACAVWYIVRDRLVLSQAPSPVTAMLHADL
jgi:transcriptional regulator with XRE-family HTH domain/quercetin dioxygenase-like cupin family protein